MAKETAKGQKTLFFIPDISGFTKFVNEVDIEHSSHILSELLEIIIESNEINLEVSEIEGDAVLFYRFGQSPSFEDLLKQCRSMFLNFHQHLKLYDRDRICECGACTSASTLSLKFIVHFGQSETMHIKEHTKLFGLDIIAAHRLLKNDIDSNEYVLITQQYLDSISDYNLKLDTEIEGPKKGEENIKDLGKVKYDYFLLTRILKDVPALPERKTFDRHKNPIKLYTEIDAPILNVFKVVSDPEFKTKFNKEVKVKIDHSKLPRIGTKHDCIFPNNTLQFETSEGKISEGSMEYAETTNDIMIFPIITFYFNLSMKEGKTLLKQEIYYNRLPIIGWLLDLVVRPKLKRIATEGLKQIKDFCEEEFLKLKKTTSQAIPL